MHDSCGHPMLLSGLHKQAGWLTDESRITWLHLNLYFSHVLFLKPVIYLFTCSVCCNQSSKQTSKSTNNIVYIHYSGCLFDSASLLYVHVVMSCYVMLFRAQLLFVVCHIIHNSNIIIDATVKQHNTTQHNTTQYYTIVIHTPYSQPLG